MRWLVLLLIFGCGPNRVRAPQELQPKDGDAWFAWRAETLGVSVDEARARDAAVTVEEPPDSLDEHTALDAAARWRTVCATCHGIDGEPPEKPGQATPRSWGGMGPAMGFTFGGDKMRAGIYKNIAEGKGDAMPAWGQTLAREQIWALVRHIESL